MHSFETSISRSIHADLNPALSIVLIPASPMLLLNSPTTITLFFFVRENLSCKAMGGNVPCARPPDMQRVKCKRNTLDLGDRSNCRSVIPATPSVQVPQRLPAEPCLESFCIYFCDLQSLSCKQNKILFPVLCLRRPSHHQLELRQSR